MDHPHSWHHQASPPRENIGAANFKLPPDDLARIEAVLRNIDVVGGRYDAQSAARGNR
jgi:hypothetical protein